MYIPVTLMIITLSISYTNRDGVLGIALRAFLTSFNPPDPPELLLPFHSGANPGRKIKYFAQDQTLIRI